MINKEIKNILKNYYINYDKKKWEKFNNDKNIKEDFYKIFKNDHGGYYTKNELINIYKNVINNNNNNIPEILPYYKNGKIYIPECSSNNIKFRQKYINECNKILLENDIEHIKLDFRNNIGGKSAAMVAALLPLFNISKRNILTYLTTQTSIKKDIIKNKNCIICISNNNEKMCGTQLKLLNVKKITIYFNKLSASAAEHTIIALMALNDIIEIKLKGDITSGATTCIKYFKLSDKSGMEIPIGYMTDINYNIYKNGIKTIK